jgi:hypothetical protein
MCPASTRPRRRQEVDQSVRPRGVEDRAATEVASSADELGRQHAAGSKTGPEPGTEKSKSKLAQLERVIRKTRKPVHRHIASW